jgi:PII-like signaling protein
VSVHLKNGKVIPSVRPSVSLFGVTVLRGVGGFGSSSRYHTVKILRLAHDFPIIIEVFEYTGKIGKLLLRLDEMVDGGMIALETASVVLCRPKQKVKMWSVGTSCRGRNGKSRKHCHEDSHNFCHGNFDALAALRENYDELWVLGDLVNYDPDPAEVIDFVRANTDWLVKGKYGLFIAWVPETYPLYDTTQAYKHYETAVNRFDVDAFGDMV